jgi:2-hydroxy-3-oxopropionate reductase
MAKLGFIGVGVMGKPMAEHLLVGNTVHVYDLNPAPVKELVAKGGIACKNSKEVAEASDIIFIMAPNSPDVEAILFGKNGVAEGLKQGKIVVDMSSISPISAKEFAKKLTSMGVKMLDAPVSGGETGATNATLSIMVGGDPEVFEKIKPYFEKMGKTIQLIGGNGDGQTCKVANQIVAGIHTLAAAESLIFAAKAGANLPKVIKAITGGSGGPGYEGRANSMLEHNFKPGFRIALMQKDLGNALGGARILGVSLPVTAVCQELLNAVAAEGGSNLGTSAAISVLEKLSNFKVKK